jgi:hypothetical protein
LGGGWPGKGEDNDERKDTDCLYFKNPLPPPQHVHPDIHNYTLITATASEAIGVMAGLA